MAFLFLMKHYKSYIFLTSVVVMFMLWSCSWEKKVQQGDGTKKETELTRIMKSGKLKVVVDCNSTNYFIYRGKPMGFEYELLQRLARDMRVKLEICVSNDLKETFEGLADHKYDLIAKNLTITKKRTDQIDFTAPLKQTRQVLVQRKPEGWQNMSEASISRLLVRNQLNLAGKTIHVQKNTVYYTRLVHLSEEIGSDINIVQDSILGVEELIAQVAKGKIDYTVCDENVARVNQNYYPNLDVQTPISFPQNIAWAVRHDSPEWKSYLNNWILNFKKTADFRYLYKKYYQMKRSSFISDSDYQSYSGGKLSPYDDIIKKISAGAGIDWRFTAAVIYRESRFDPEAESWNGAYGLMQVLPESADMFRILDYEKPENNVEAGVHLLKWIDDQFKPEIPDSTERIKFDLAAYNVGIGHVKDAQRLAAKYDKDPVKWTGNVDYYLLSKSVEKYYEDPIVKFGYCRGEEPFSFVNEVLDTYRHYCNLIKK